ncbi:alkyl/aryl-sulfatase [Pseudomaricurvus alcaniphilus]|uniref:alkyl/aryl-sulfatase n=1 Tax=Pseudomaricurvus alcaniphilus TaxID=1166482 RepID=UPI00140CF446|nr:alkyl/aryl-sulfatase [Pseudomaricurvus alcaniphilus]NHN38052.1 alkyl/aryl-sulfatase [Pseudomaricurvus alcaniphilus]
MTIKSGFMGVLALSLAASQGVSAGTQVDPATALSMLKAQNQQFEQQVVKVADNVYTAVGFHGANTSMIVGDDGVIIVDTLRGPKSAASAYSAFRAYSDKPVKAIIYTHSHGDHIGGASGFTGAEQVEIYAMESFGSAEEGLNKSVNPIKIKRNVRQFGRNLPPHERTNRGVAPAGTEDRDGGTGFLAPTVKIPHGIHKTTIAGVDLEFHYGPGETDDAMFVWLPAEKVLFSGDNFYSAFPNLYAIRGTAYRDVLDWSASVAKMAELKPRSLVPGHTLPIQGAAATTALADYSEAIRSVYDQTVTGINEGKSPEQIAHEVALPEHLRDKPYLTEFYGTVHHAVRAIYVGLLGWFDGNPTTLNPLEPRLRAEKIAELAGGTRKLTRQMQGALKKRDYQWALELADQVKWLPDGDQKLAREVKIKALRGLAEREYNAPNRNYYLSYANELESGQLNQIWF